MTQQEYQALVDEATKRLTIIGTHSKDGKVQIFITGQEAELAAARAEPETKQPGQ